MALVAYGNETASYVNGKPPERTVEPGVKSHPEAAQALKKRARGNRTVGFSDTPETAAAFASLKKPEPRPLNDQEKAKKWWSKKVEAKPSGSVKPVNVVKEPVTIKDAPEPKKKAADTSGGKS